VLVLAPPNPEGKQDGRSTPGRREAPAQAMPVAIRMSIVGAAPAPLVSGLEELPGKANYFIGKDPAKWRTNVPTYAKVHYREIYPGIDLVYYGNQRQLEYDFVVAPGADPNKIVLGFKGADKIEIDAQGDLVLDAPGGAIRQHKPVIYQEIDGVRQEIAGSYVRKSANRVGFKVAAYDQSRPLIIDPVVLSYSTYLGGTGNDTGAGIAVDANGNAYVTGSASSGFPTTPGAFNATGGGVFVTKLNAAGTALVYSTYLGIGSGGAIAVDADGNAYVTGSASSDFPTTPGALNATGGGVFVTKLNATGSALVYSACFGGSRWEKGNGIAVDAMGHAYVTGSTLSADFPTTAGAFQPIFGGGPSDENGKPPEDAFVTKLNPTATGLIYSTYLGGIGDDHGNGIAIDPDGNAYVTGDTKAINFPTTPTSFQPVFGGARDAFVTKLHATGSLLLYSTYLGGSDDDIGYAIAVDAGGNAFVTGQTLSANFPTTPGAFQSPASNGFPNSAFVTKLHSTGSTLVYSTCLGGTGVEIAFGIALDASGNAYVTGATGSSDFPTTPGAFQPNFAGFQDAFVTKVNPAGAGLVYSTYLGGSDADQGSGIAVDVAGNAYVTGFTRGANFPTTAGAFQPVFGGAQFYGDGDAFVAKIAEATQPSPPYSGTPFTGTPFAIPGTFEAEDFDRGGEGVAYHDNVPGNAGGQYRPNEDVDIIVSSDSDGGGYVVNNFETGEWMKYTINVQTATNHDIELRVTSAFADSAFHVEIDGVDVTGRISVPNTGSWSSFQWVGKKGIPLTAGKHVLKIVSDQQYFDLNSVRVLQSTTRFEENAAAYTGAWNTYGPETGTFSGGTIAASNQIAATASFAFTGTAVNWIGVKCNVCGVATVSIDGGIPTVVNTASPDAPGSLTSDVVFSASGLAPDVAHTLAITVTGVGTALPGLLTGGAYVAVDAFDVTR
jgi:carbohydrate binding protein with CBM6 domain/beta-propeller repeat-containing protein